MTKPSSRRLLTLALLALPVLALAGIFAPGPLSENKTVVVSRGESGREIATQLAGNGVIWNSLLFRMASRLLGHGGLKAGEYEFTAGQSIADAVRMMRDGRSVARYFTAAEGLTSADIAELLKNDPVLAGDIPVPTEGSLLPETYRYSYGDARSSLVGRMQKAMNDALAELWLKRDTSVPLRTPQQAVIMASVIEKETGKPEERPRIAGVFYNRLTHSMRLQSDPTVIYGITQGLKPLGRPLDREDLGVTSLYNTYTNDGLPPGPICNPGRAAIEAALHPEQNDFLYFVADGTGGHVFAHNLEEHNRNVAKWNQVKAAVTPVPQAKPPHE